MSVDWMELPEDVRLDIMFTWMRESSLERYWCGCKRDTATGATELCATHLAQVEEQR
jgi:hypothetical protein